MKEKRRGEESESIERGSKGVLDAFRKYFVVGFGIECGKSRSLTLLLGGLRGLSVIPVSTPSPYTAAPRY